MKAKHLSKFLLIPCLTLSYLYAQTETPDLGTVHGSFQTDVQYTFPDSIIKAEDRAEKILSNTQLQLLYTRGKFEAGARYEMYQTPLLGFDSRYLGLGVPYRFARYKGELLDITVGNFYDQFGKGSIFRAYQEWTLGIDNSIDGIRVKLKPTKGIILTGILGKQRAFWDKSPGIVRAADLNVSFNEVIKSMKDSKTNVTAGVSVVSKFQKDDNPTLKLPQNTAAVSARAGVTRGGFDINAEAAYKSQDPSATNKYSYNPGNFLYFGASYSRKGFALSGSIKRVDNMDFRSNRQANLNAQTLSFLPPITRTHTYRLPTLYPYATQPNGEFGGQMSLYYRIKKGTLIGGKYGIQIAINYARINALDTTHTSTRLTDSTTTSKYTYTSSFVGGKGKFLFEDVNVEITKKWSPKFKQQLTYIYLGYNKNIVQFSEPNAEYGTIFSHNAILESSYQFNDNHAIRTEMQHMFINKKNEHQDFGNWAMLLVEYSVAPHWYFTVFDEYNYGNPEAIKRVHYFSGQVAYVKDAHRVSIGYGRQREGLLCVGGICRVVPASNGFMISLNSSF